MLKKIRKPRNSSLKLENINIKKYNKYESERKEKKSTKDKTKYFISKSYH